MSSQDMFAAVSFAITWHKDQKRKYTNEPYVLHPIAVAKLLEAKGFGKDVVYAGLFHDLVEDTDCTLDIIADKFGARVAELVDMVTDVSTPMDGNRKARKEIDRNHLAVADSDGQAIKCADIINNTSDIIKHDLAFAKVYTQEMRLLMGVLSKAPRAMQLAAWVSISNAESVLKGTPTWKD